MEFPSLSLLVFLVSSCRRPNTSLNKFQQTVVQSLTISSALSILAGKSFLFSVFVFCEDERSSHGQYLCFSICGSPTYVFMQDSGYLFVFPANHVVFFFFFCGMWGLLAVLRLIDWCSRIDVSAVVCVNWILICAWGWFFVWFLRFNFRQFGLDVHDIAKMVKTWWFLARSCWYEVFVYLYKIGLSSLLVCSCTLSDPRTTAKNTLALTL